MLGIFLTHLVSQPVKKKPSILRYAFNTKPWHYTSYWQSSHSLRWKCDLALKGGEYV